MPKFSLVNAWMAIQNMINALETGGDVGATVVSVRAAFDHVSAQRVFYGNTLNPMDAQETFLKGEQLQLASQQNSLVGVNLAEAASRLANATSARNAAVTAVGEVFRQRRLLGRMM